MVRKLVGASPSNKHLAGLFAFALWVAPLRLSLLLCFAGGSLPTKYPPVFLRWREPPHTAAFVKTGPPLRGIIHGLVNRVIPLPCGLQVLSAVFYAFEETPGKGVCVAEIVGGLSLLCAGNKSSKLAVSDDDAFGVCCPLEHTPRARAALFLGGSRGKSGTCRLHHSRL